MQPGERVFVLLTSGSLSVSSRSSRCCGDDFDAGHGLARAKSLYDAARIVGERSPRFGYRSASLERDSYNFNVHLLMADRSKAKSRGLYLVYPQGNPLPLPRILSICSSARLNTAVRFLIVVFRLHVAGGRREIRASFDGFDDAVERDGRAAVSICCSTAATASWIERYRRGLCRRRGRLEFGFTRSSGAIAAPRRRATTATPSSSKTTKAASRWLPRANRSALEMPSQRTVAENERDTCCVRRWVSAARVASRTCAVLDAIQRECSNLQQFPVSSARCCAPLRAHSPIIRNPQVAERSSPASTDLSSPYFPSKVTAARGHRSHRCYQIADRASDFVT